MRMMIIFTLVAGLTIGIAHPSHASVIQPPTTSVGGKSLGEWSGEWWTWALSFPTPTNPLLDQTGAHADQGDVGQVLFLAGTFGGGNAERTFSMPAGHHIFFPLINSFETLDSGTEETARARAAAVIDNVSELHFNIDDEEGENLFTHRHQSPVFNIILPEDNIFGLPELAGIPLPTVADGYYLMLPPLTPGTHTITFGGATSDFDITVTDHITVGQVIAVPEPSTLALLGTPMLLLVFQSLSLFTRRPMRLRSQ
jgi:hypothetical protein